MPDIDRDIEARIRFEPAREMVEIDFSHLTFEGQADVNPFFDHLDWRLGQLSGRVWFVLDYTDLVISRRAHIVFGVRAERARSAHARGTIRYARPPSFAPVPLLLRSRAEALAQVDAIRRTSHPPSVRARAC
ncbi:MAG: hypothetical protein MRY63_10335 [Neomegalonema sp.]|nr:hypothetical protein [Neomegalonema sp.]